MKKFLMLACLASLVSCVKTETAPAPAADAGAAAPVVAPEAAPVAAH